MAMLGYLSSDWTLVLLMVEKMLPINDRGRAGYLQEMGAWGNSPYDLGALATYWLGLYERSCEYAAKALELEPDNPRLRKNLELAEMKLRDQRDSSKRPD